MIKAAVGTVLVGSLILGSALTAVAQDEPDLQREKRLHEIYKRFNTKPTSEEKWNQAMQGTSAQTYKVQGGDTLWDISETFFADPDFWPKIWSLNNNQITNPHSIRPNEEVQFVPGTLGEPPSIAVGASAEKSNAEGGLAQAGEGEGEDEQPKAEPEPPQVVDELGKIKKKTSTPQYVDIDLADLDLPAPIAKNNVKSATNLPASLPGWAIQPKQNAELKVELTPIQRTIGANEVMILSYVQEGELPSAGIITEAEAGMDMAHEGQYVTVRLPNAAVGQHFLVVRESGPIENFAHDNAGTLIQIDGEVQIQDAVNADENLYRALVLKSYSPILHKSKLVAGEVQKASFEASSGAGEAQAHVVGGPHSSERHIFGPGELLFLDGGTKAGLNIGQNLNVFRVEKTRDSATEQKINPRPIGQVRILRTGDNFATAIVTAGTEEVYVGDSTTRSVQVK